MLVLNMMLKLRDYCDIFWVAWEKALSFVLNYPLGKIGKNYRTLWA